MRLQVSGFRCQGKRERADAFTLIELLMVIVVIGILFGMVTSAVMHSQKVARKRKAESDCRTIAAGITFYRQHYGVWPLDNDLGDDRYRAFSNDNHLVMTCLRTNLAGKAFLREGDYRFDSITNIVSPWNDPYVITINAKNHAVEHPVGGEVPADSVRVILESLQ